MSSSTDNDALKETSVTFMSYNPTGLDSTVKCRFSNDICSEYDVDFLAIQEHFKSTKNTDQYFKKKFPDYFSYVVAAHRSPGQEYGRAKAGIAQLTRKALDVKKSRVVTRGYRVQGQVLDLPSSRVLWLNTYLPPDPQTVGQYDDTELREVLAEVENILASTSYDDVIWGSDLNWDMTRVTFFSRTMQSFLDRTGLVSLWSHHSVPYTHVHTDGRSKSTIDHILLSPRLVPLVEGCGIIERGDNLSRHCPIWVRLKLGELPVRPSPRRRWVPKKPSWSKASNDEVHDYTARLETKLLGLQVPGTGMCTDLHCRNHEHCQDRDDLLLDILDLIVKTSHTSLPTYGGR